ncbi:MAG: hypothetical protein KU37_10615 [Sulfuricurvum sp. PC08-66]|nr:MAG: hypothetical protein KU37_10615 [Sulfuricurvum sp. PC08-66]
MTGLIVDIDTHATTTYGTRHAQRLSPCSTFKIPHSLIALHTHAVDDENQTIAWDGIVREYEVWNRTHSMRSAIAVSTVWFYQALARRIGAVRMQEMVAQIGYGNGDTSSELTHFWLGNGSLKISVQEQVAFLRRLVRYELPFSRAHIDTVKNILSLGDNLYGKTGTCADTGWFVGFVIEGNVTKIFAFNLLGEGASGVEAKRVAKEFL